MEAEMETIYLSKTRLNTYCLCPEKYRLTSVEKILMEKTPVNMIEGSAIHHIVENALVYGKHISQMAEAASEEYWSKINIQETEYPDEAALEKAKDKILAESKLFLEKIGPLNTWQMEKYFEHPLVNPVSSEVNESIIIKGYTDLIDSPQKDITRLIDIKTSAKSPSPNQAERAMELTVYSYLMGCVYGFHIEMPVSLLYLVRTKEPKIVWLNSIRKLPDFLYLYDTITRAATAIRQGLFWKNQGMQCSWCQHLEICFGKTFAA